MEIYSCPFKKHPLVRHSQKPAKPFVAQQLRFRICENQTGPKLNQIPTLLQGYLDNINEVGGSDLVEGLSLHKKPTFDYTEGRGLTQDTTPVAMR